MKDVTFIIPVRIDSKDREFNFLRVIQHLCDTFETNIIISESDEDSKVIPLLKRIPNKHNCVITHYHEFNTDGIFHRTRLLNEMIVKSTTPVVVNYDVDVILKKEAYLFARHKIVDEGYDLIYPYANGSAQIQVNFPHKTNYRGENLFEPCWHTEWWSLAGHVQFLKRSSYIEGGMENENFISYGAEDRERMDRFIKLGYKVDWCSDFKVYHLEHSRGINSSPQNPHFGRNETIYYQLNNLTKDELIEYYKNVEYLKKYMNNANKQ